MKSYTDIEQSKKLAEILPIESADTWYWEWPTAPKYNNYEHPMFHKGDDIVNVPCWSLAALLDQLEDIVVDENGYEYNLQIIKEGVQYYLVYEGMLDAACYETSLYDDLIDCCYEMILKLKEKNLI